MRHLILFPALLASLLSLAACGSSTPEDHQDEQGHAHDDSKGHPQSKKHDEKKGHSEGDQHEAGVSESGGHSEAIKLTPEAIQAAQLEIAPAAPGTIRETLSLYGVVKPNAERIRSVTARFPGVVRSVSAKIGDTVRQGQTLATVESNESLQVYPITSPLGGMVTERATNPGEQAESTPLFTVADLGTVWVELALFPRDRGRVQVGQAVRVQTADGGPVREGKIVFVSPLGALNTQSLTARVLLDNADGSWSPGLYVRGEVTIGESSAALVVPAAALQELEGGTSVFVETPEGFISRPVKVGRSDGLVVEVLDGIKAGDAVVGEGSFVLKAELGKGEAEHDH
ncbi:efflux RND transporter periplasmic adaptor subunit [Hydrocarboniphaga sp.]|jgi:cobalt-zinc-cadmium efflux system membrane fusion protein|uniref:efflux RND transporter periplasmic adaptor subunit n=1 Tax=Hydrocarboniphaga sp. TaxID=2033016 RepID=UPI002ABAD75F|nr:efflux RND transporter periplasmic adaptor subunit [Hydrocarboniphaga sp.]MDZ4078470.1 efflux RND transporter periplasmic adaptor subunit [Hydrocarboniphaga sp.]